MGPDAALKVNSNYGSCIKAAPSSQPMSAEARAEPQSELDSAQAWLTLGLVFVLNATTLGSLKVYGIIFDEVVKQGVYNREDASWPIATATTVQNLAGLLTPLLATKLSWRSVEFIQSGLFVASNLGAFWSRSLALDVLLLGVAQGVAFSLRYNMNVMINNEYFAKYRSTAMGISLAGSSCGVFLLKPLINYVIDETRPNFRNAYLALALVMSTNFILSWFIRKPKEAASSSQGSQATQRTSGEASLGPRVWSLLQTWGLHCIWIMQSIYFYTSRTYPIFMVDFGSDIGLSQSQSRSLLDFWVFGELAGRFLLGGLVDSQLAELSTSLSLVNLLLSVAGFALILEPSLLVGEPKALFWAAGLTIFLVAAVSSLVNMMIVPFGQEYLGKAQVPWAYALASVLTSVLLLLRPLLIGISRDSYKSYNLLIGVMALAALLYALGLQLVHLLKLMGRRQRHQSA